MKIAIINKTQYYIDGGGMDLYDRNVIELILSLGHDVDHFYTYEGNHTNFTGKTDKVITKKIDKPSKFIEELIDSKKYDLIINNNPIATKKIIDSDNVIIVQHADYKEYWENCLIGYKISSFFSKNKLFGNPLLKAKAVVYYSKSHSINNPNQKQYFAPLYSRLNFNAKQRNPKNIFYASRLNFHHKGIDRIPKIMKHIKEYQNDWVIAGKGPKENFAKDNLKENFVGKLSKEQMLEKFNNARVSVITSRWEGFSYFAVESLTLGVPIVAYDTFDSLNFFKESGGCFVVKDKDHKGFAEQIEKIMKMSDEDYKKMSNNIVKWASKNLSKKSFEDGWEKVFKDFENKK